MGAIKESYVDLVRSVFGAEAAPLGDSFEPINAWVAGKTGGLITDLLQGKPDPLLVAVLVSAVHFRGEWASRFDGALTTAGTFTTAEGAARSVQFMHKTADLAASGGIAALGGAAAVRLDYGTGGSAPADYCAMFVLPAEPGAAAARDGARDGGGAARRRACRAREPEGESVAPAGQGSVRHAIGEGSAARARDRGRFRWQRRLLCDV